MAEICWICKKEKGQPPKRCNGHYDMNTANNANTELLTQRKAAWHQFTIHNQQGELVEASTQVLDEDSRLICDAQTPEIAAQIVREHRKATAFDAMTERGWRAKQNEIDKLWRVGRINYHNSGFGPTPLQAVEDAIRRAGKERG